MMRSNEPYSSDDNKPHFKKHEQNLLRLPLALTFKIINLSLRKTQYMN